MTSWYASALLLVVLQCSGASGAPGSGEGPFFVKGERFAISIYEDDCGFNHSDLRVRLQPSVRLELESSSTCQKVPVTMVDGSDVDVFVGLLVEKHPFQTVKDAAGQDTPLQTFALIARSTQAACDAKVISPSGDCSEAYCFPNIALMAVGHCGIFFPFGPGGTAADGKRIDVDGQPLPWKTVSS